MFTFEHFKPVALFRETASIYLSLRGGGIERRAISQLAARRGLTSLRRNLA